MDYQVDDYVEGSGTMQYAYDAFDGVAETKRVLSWCVPFDIVGFAMGLLILCLSGVRHKSKFNMGPRIFTANMVIFNLIHSIVSFFFDFAGPGTDFSTYLYSTGVGSILMTNADVVRSYDMMVFNCSLIPLMGMSILACFTTQRISEKGAAFRFAGIVGISDVVPLVIQIVNVSTVGSRRTSVSVLYMAATFLFYAIQVAMTVTALVVLHKKSKGHIKAGNKDTTPNKNLVRLLVFAAGPCLLQIPFALYLIVDKASKGSELAIRLSLAARLIFSMKPTIDAIFTLLFLGEYRQYTINFYKWLREKLTGHHSGQTTTRVTEFQRKAPATHSPIPSTVSGHINNIRDGARSSVIARSSSLPVQITTIST